MKKNELPKPGTLYEVLNKIIAYSKNRETPEKVFDEGGFPTVDLFVGNKFMVLASGTFKRIHWPKDNICYVQILFDTKICFIFLSEVYFDKVIKHSFGILK